MWWSLSLCVIVIWLAGYAVSTLLARVSSATVGDQVLFAFPVGWTVIGWIEFCGNEFGGLSITAAFVYAVTLPLAGLGSALLILQVRVWWRRRAGKSTALTSRTPSLVSQWTWLAWVELGIIVLLLARQVIEYLMTPIITADAIRYHLPYAKIIYQTHALPQFTSPSMADLFFTSPPLLFLWYATVWLWLGKIHLFVPSLTTLIIGGHVCVLVYRAARRILGVDPQAALGAVLCLLLPGTFIGLMQMKSTSDVPFAFWGMATIYCLLLGWTEKKEVRWIWVGVCGALACWTKPYGYVFGVVCIGGMLLGLWLRQNKWGTAWPYSINTICKLIMAWGGLVFPLLLRSWLRWDNPIYPGLLGGYLVDDWALQHNVMLLNSYSWDWTGVLEQLFSEPVVALSGLVILHPRVRQSPFLQMLWLIAAGYILFYILLFGKTFTNLIPGAHARYLVPSIVLFGVLVACFLDRRAYPVDGWFQWVLAGGLVAQVGRVSYKLWTGTWHSTSPSLADLTSFKAMAYEWLPFLLVGGFGGIALFFRRWPIGLIWLRLALMSGCCLLLSYPWPLTQPWMLLLKPLQNSSVDWTAIPSISPYGTWVQAHLPKSAVLLIDDDRRWIIPRQILPADSPLLQTL